MRPFFIMFVCLVAFSATPAKAHWGQDRTFSRQLQAQIDDGVSHGRISSLEAAQLRQKLDRLAQLEREFMPNGISGPEYAVLFQRGAALSKEIRVIASHTGRSENTPPMTWESRNSDGRWIPDARFAGLRPGDRFSGDSRIGQRVTARVGKMPDQYRTDYVDTDQIYYGYDNGRVYQIDRKSQTILALLDLMR